MERALFTNNSDEWTTPKYLYNELNKRFKFTLDPCSTNENHLCDKYFTKEDDGLSKSWKGETVYVNPPYSNIKKWVEKCYMEHKTNGTSVVMLIPSRTDTIYFHNYIYHKADIKFIKGRLHFSNSKNSAPFPSMIVIYKWEINNLLTYLKISSTIKRRKEE